MLAMRSLAVEIPALLAVVAARAVKEDPLLDRKDLKARGYGRYAIDNAVRDGKLKEGPPGPHNGLRILKSELERWEASKVRPRKPRKPKDPTWTDEEAAEVARLKRLAGGKHA